MIGEDDGTPKLSATCTVQISVIRNEHSPFFTQQKYNATMEEYAAIQSSVLRVVATDLDNSNVSIVR